MNVDVLRCYDILNSYMRRFTIISRMQLVFGEGDAIFLDSLCLDSPAVNGMVVVKVNIAENGCPD